MYITVNIRMSNVNYIIIHIYTFVNMNVCTHEYTDLHICARVCARARVFYIFVYIIINYFVVYDFTLTHTRTHIHIL